LQTGSGCVARSIHPREQRHRVPAPWITTATRPGVCVGA
jgi:hypothetical protein